MKWKKGIEGGGEEAIGYHKLRIEQRHDDALIFDVDEEHDVGQQANGQRSLQCVEHDARVLLGVQKVETARQELVGSDLPQRLRRVNEKIERTLVQLRSKIDPKLIPHNTTKIGEPVEPRDSNESKKHIKWRCKR